MTKVNYFHFAQNTTFHISTEWRQLSINGPMDWLSARCGDQLLEYHAFIGMNLSKDNYCPTGGLDDIPCQDRRPVVFCLDKCPIRFSKTYWTLRYRRSGKHCNNEHKQFLIGVYMKIIFCQTLSYEQNAS